MTVFNLEERNNKQYMFFGDALNVARYDKVQHSIFDKLTKKQKSFFWQPEEVELAKDIKDFKILTDAGRSIATDTVSYQSMLDSVQGRSPLIALLPHCSLPELESCITWWGAMENMHNYSYEYLLENVYPNFSEVFDNIMKNENIIKRAKSTIKYYDDFIRASNSYRFLGGHSGNTNDDNENSALSNLKRKLLLCIVSINALEGLSFYASFACSFALAEQGLMMGNASIISLIARDEALHLAITQNILKKWRDGEDDPEMQNLYYECIPEIKLIYDNIVEQEKEWCKYLFRNGTILGLNEKILVEYVEYMAGKRLKNLGIKHDYNIKNPLTWMDKYLKSSDNQVAPQESEILSYIIGGVKNDVESTDFANFLD